MSWSHVQHNANGDASGGTGASISVTISAVSSGSVVSGITIWEDDIPASLNSVTNDKGDSATILDHTTDTTNGQGISSFVFLNPTVGATVFTANFSTTTAFYGIEVDEDTFGAGFTYSTDGHTGVFQSSPGAGANVVNSGSITPGTNGDLIKGFAVNSGGSPTYSAGTSPNTFTQRNQIAGGGTDFSFFSEDFIQTTAASIAATMGTSGSAPTHSFVVAIKATAAGDTLMPQIWL